MSPPAMASPFTEPPHSFGTEGLNIFFRAGNCGGQDQTLDGPFSAVSRPTIARLDAFFSIFQNLHVVRSFAPLETQFFAKKSSLFSANFAIHRCKTRFHDEFFDEF